MTTVRRLVMTPLVALVVYLMLGSAASADDHYFNESAYREYRAAKRQQVGDLCDIWCATWRPGTVGKTYVVLACQFDQIDVSRCSSALRKHVKKAERTCTEIGELFGQSTMPDIEAVLVSIKGAGGFKSSSTVTSERGRRVLELMRDLSASEEAVVRELALDQ